MLKKVVFFVFLGTYIFGYSQELTKGTLETAGLDSVIVNSKIDSIMTLGIQNHAFPGAQVLVAKNSKIVFHKTYGFHTYDSIQKVNLDDVYDLASVTKIMASTLALMKLHSEGKIDLDVPFSNYWEPWKRRKGKKKLTVREVLAHQAGLKPYIIFLNETLKKNGKLKRRFVRTAKSPKFSKQAYDALFVKDQFKQTMYRQINRSKVADEKKYRYSGLTFLLYPEIVEQLTGTEFSTYLEDNFYKPMGANTMSFLPKLKHYSNALVPTELDTIFRKELTKDWVHDENAALLGGISGNAGLFASATDLAKMMQLFLNYGTYNGKRYLAENTVREFIKIQYPDNENRRGLGFDKPTIGNDTLPLAKSYPAPEASPESFGHSGFTGTFVWADPKNQMIFIFLSNRVYPTRANRSLYELNIRSALQQVFYLSRL